MFSCVPSGTAKPTMACYCLPERRIQRGGIMKKLLMASVGACVLGAAGSALGADLRAPVRYRPAPPVAVADWSGFYIGGVAGMGWSRSDVDPIGTTAFCQPTFRGCAAGIGPGGERNNAVPANTFGAAINAAIPPSIATNPKGGMFGGTLGYNYQFGRWLLGAETDLSYTNISGGSTQSGVVPTAFFPDAISITATADQRLSYFGTVRGRLGWVPVDPLLIYATGGLAYGRIETNLAIGGAVLGPCGGGAVSAFSCPFTGAVGTASSVRTGWTVGGGLEYAIAYGWSVKAEYLYFNLGSPGITTSALALASNNAAGTVLTPFVTTAITSTTSDFKGNVVRVGLNYKFGSWLSVR
jgi:outer membrane immunogenic protein